MSDSVVIALPTRGYFRAETTWWLLNMKGHPSVQSFQSSIGQLGIDKQRNELVRIFLAIPNATHLFFLDDDVVPPRNAIDRMLSANKDIVTGAVPVQKISEIVLSVHKLRDSTRDDPRMPAELFRIAEPQKSGLEKVDGCGAACMLIRREVFEKTEYPWFDCLHYDKPEHRVGEDLFFCLNARKAGFSIWVDWSIRCKHIRVATLEVS